MKKLITVALSLMFVVCLSYTVIAGSLDSPGAPSGGSGMYTLQNLYDYLTSGTALTVQTSFQEPTSGPTSGTMKTTKQIGDDIAALFGQCPATADNVESGVKFFCTQPGSWGVRTGTLATLPRPTATPTPTITPTRTMTPTPTITPTLTPVWLGWCNTKGGHWLSDGLGGMACWFEGSARGDTCTATCSALGGSCWQAQWNDSTDCSVCKSWHSSAGCFIESWDQPYAPMYGGNTRPSDCYRRNTGSQVQDCTAAIGEQRSTPGRVCVCLNP